MNNQSSIKVKLLSNGRYTWEINVIFDMQAGANKPDSPDEAIKLAKFMDGQLRSEFPDHPVKAFGRTVELED